MALFGIVAEKIMKHLRVIGSLSAVAFGISLVAMSLVSVSQVQSQGLEYTEKEMYFQHEVLPDHALYPALMARDRVLLELAQPDDRISIRVELAGKRMRSAEMLLEKGKTELALSTATKAQKYLLTAVLEAQNLSVDETVLIALKATLQAQTEQLERLQTHFEGAEHDVLQQLLLQSQAALQ